jgi:excisionase family DNA binding protein
MNEYLFEDRVLTVPQVAEYLQISKAKIYYLVQRKEIPHIRINRNVRIRESDLKKWLELQIEKG